MDGKGSTISPKSRASLRTVPILSVELRQVLTEHRDASRALADDFVFAGASPTDPLTPSNIHRRVRVAWRRAKIEPINLHEARHTFASTAIAAGLNAKVIATYMGHSSTSTAS